MMTAFFVIPACIVIIQFHSLLVALGAGLLLGMAPYAFVMIQARPAVQQVRSGTA